MINYQKELDETELQIESTWEDNYSNYLTKINNTKDINKKVIDYNTNLSSPLGIYSSISEIDNHKYAIRYLGQNIATYNSEKIKLADNIHNYFDCNIDIEGLDELTALERLNGLKLKQKLHSPEHIFESRILKYMNLGKDKKYLRNMTPVKFQNGLFFQMPTFFKGSKHNELVEYMVNGGGIDIFARVKIKGEAASKNNHLCIMELKDEFDKKGETPDLIMKQAITYACCIHTLLRSSNGTQWYNFFRDTNDDKKVPNSLVLYACVVTPIKKGQQIPEEYKIEEELRFKEKSDILKLRYMYLPMNDNLTEISDEPITNLELYEK